MLRKILIVDDEETNRRILSRMLRDQYEVIEAGNGMEAMQLLKDAGQSISAVLLDLVMPVMGGFEVLEAMRKTPALSQIPIIITTSNSAEDAEVKALSLGANDYITKPYNPPIIRHRLHNTIILRETAAVVNAIQRDPLTNLYNRNAFFQKAEEMIARREPGYYVMACYDVNNFKVINDQYGNAKGDDVLRQIARTLDEGFSTVGGLCGRIMADHFAVLYPKSFIETEEIEMIRKKTAVLDGSIQPLSFSIGRYIVTETSLSASAMYDRATIAAAFVKARFDTRIAQYDESMRESILREQEIIDEMNAALEQRQFETWLQPQYNHSSGALIGSEALVRWRHPKKGLIPPGEFVPVFERNGFIYEMDKFVWEEVASLLRKWIDEGKDPLPVSVNVSRYDMFREDFYEVITGLIERYGVPLNLLRLEVTESAFAVSAEQIVRMVKRLIDYGFTIEIDDFGSGYSSLNTLKDVPANILKLDMRFLEGSDNSSRGGNILESIVRMAKWLGMPVIAEGVETKEQADYLRSIGCFYVQGYLYGRPMPAAEYERLAEKAGKEHGMSRLETVETLDNNAFWDPKSLETLIFNSYVGGACIFEYHAGKTELLRINEKYAQEIGCDSIEEALNVELFRHLDEANAAVLNQNICNALRTDAESSCEICLNGLHGHAHTYLRASVRVIARTGDRALLYCSVINVTARREAERKERETAAQLSAIMGNINGGVTAVTMDEGGNLQFIFANEQFYSQLGYTKEQFHAEVPSIFDIAHPDDRERVMRETAYASAAGEPFSITYRVYRRDHSLAYMKCNISITQLSGFAGNVQICVANDITAQVEAERKERETTAQLSAIMGNIRGGVSAVTIDKNGAVRFIFANDQYYSMLGYTRKQFVDEVREVFLLVHPDDRDEVVEKTIRATETGESFSCVYRAIRRDGSIIWIESNISITAMLDVTRPVQIAVANDITARKLAEQKEREAASKLQGFMDNVHGGVSAATLIDGAVTYIFVNDW